jgi:hypothetical protein
MCSFSSLCNISIGEHKCTVCVYTLYVLSLVVYSCGHFVQVYVNDLFYPMQLHLILVLLHQN